MLLLVGLGNPGSKYAVADRHGFGPEKSKFQGLVREGVIQTDNGPKKAITLKPSTFMNESGRSVHLAAKFYKIDLDQIVVFHDELDLDPGKFRIKIGGGIAGHNGLRSIRQHMSAEFIRARMGIGHPGHKDKVHSYVLSDFAKAENTWVEDLNDACARNADLLAEAELTIDQLNKYSTKVTYMAPAPK